MTFPTDRLERMLLVRFVDRSRRSIESITRDRFRADRNTIETSSLIIILYLRSVEYIIYVRFDRSKYARKCFANEGNIFLFVFFYF